jgi:hypothetical protein
MTTNIQPTSTPSHIHTAQPVEKPPPIGWLMALAAMRGFTTGGAAGLIENLKEYGIQLQPPKS